MREFTVIRNQRNLEDAAVQQVVPFKRLAGTITALPSSTKMLAGVVVVVGAVALGLAMRQPDVLGTNTAANEVRAQEVIDSFARIYEFDEDPSVAMIVDVESLRAEQPNFYADASNGDALIIFPQKQIAILYRPASGKIINTAPVDLPAVRQEGEQAPVPTDPSDFLENDL